jgi:hypothetical protein
VSQKELYNEEYLVIGWLVASPRYVLASHTQQQ